MQGHVFRLAALPIILVAEDENPVLVQVSDAVVGYGHLMGIPAEVLQHGFGPVERSFGINHPMLAEAFAAPLGKRA